MTYMKGHSTVQWFVSNDSECTPRTFNRWPPRWISIRRLSLSPHLQTSQAFCREAIVRKRLTHPNVAPLLGITVAPFQLISDWAPNGDLLEYIKENPKTDRPRLVCSHALVIIPHLSRHQVSDIAGGLNYLHSCGVVHRALKGVRGSKSSFPTH